MPNGTLLVLLMTFRDQMFFFLFLPTFYCDAFQEIAFVKGLLINLNFENLHSDVVRSFLVMFGIIFAFLVRLVKIYII